MKDSRGRTYRPNPTQLAERREWIADREAETRRAIRQNKENEMKYRQTSAGTVPRFPDLDPIRARLGEVRERLMAAFNEAQELQASNQAVAQASAPDPSRFGQSVRGPGSSRWRLGRAEDGGPACG